MKERIQCQVAVIGGGMAGMCAAIAAAREGAHTVLIHNRPVLGGNASSEIRMHICGADHHARRENARETGLIEEILLEHKHRNPENSYAVFDAVLWEKAAFQENLSLYLNAHMTGAETEEKRIRRVDVVQLTTEKQIQVYADIYIDATGDGTLGFFCGADFAVGREGRDIYGEAHAPKTSDQCTMGSSLMFKARDMGRPVPFIKPFWANTYTEADLRLRDHSQISSGYWWIELGGRDRRVIEDGEEIRDELLKAVYGVWDHIKNTPGHHAENMELEWVGYLPGKRESRRLLGDYVLKENDCQTGRIFEDAVAYGGWPMDVHVVDGLKQGGEDATVYLHTDDVYSIPYRCFYSRNIENLMMAGRDISCSHLAFASARVMGTCAVGGQAAGIAAAMAARERISPRKVGEHIGRLQQELLWQDCYIPGVIAADKEDVAKTAVITASSAQKGFEPELVANGVGRTTGAGNNCWRPKEEEKPWIQFALPGEAAICEVQCLFDSELSREITISISDEVLMRQENHTPSALIKSFRIQFFRKESLVKELEVRDNYQRLCRLRLQPEVICDRVLFEIEETWGTKQPRVFEIRMRKVRENECGGKNQRGEESAFE